jgi:hypothetical protein
MQRLRSVVSALPGVSSRSLVRLLLKAARGMSKITAIREVTYWQWYLSCEARLTSFHCLLLSPILNFDG